MSQALSIFRSDRNIVSSTRAMTPACKTTTSSSGLIKTKSEKTNSPNRRIHFLQNSRSSRMYRYTANPPITSAIKISMADLLSDLNMLSLWLKDKMNKTGNLLFGVARKRRQRKPFRGLHLLFGSHHSEVSGMQATVACKDPVAPVALMTSGSFDCAAAGLEGSVTPPSKGSSLSKRIDASLDASSHAFGGLRGPGFSPWLDCVRPAGHNAQAISVVEAAYQGRSTPARGGRSFLLGA